MEIPILALVLLVLAGLGVLIAFTQLLTMQRHRRRRYVVPSQLPGVSILKPLCGIDDGLAANLERFAHLDYPEYELLLGVKDVSDPAFPLAQRVARENPERVRVVVQRGSNGFNPKINQLVTLAKHARYDLYVVSDSNVRVERDYLIEIAAHLCDSDVGLVTHPVRGLGERSLGAAMDNLHMTTTIAAGVVGAKTLARQDIVVGKSMAMRRADLERLGGFAAFENILAEDYFMGRAVRARLGKRVALASGFVTGYVRHMGIAQVYARYRRWSVMHRNSVPLPFYLGACLLNPLSLAGAASLLAPACLPIAVTLATLKIACDMTLARQSRAMPTDLSTVAALVLKDLLMTVCWIHGLVSNTVEWRGNRLVVLAGTRIAPPRDASGDAAVESVQ